MTKTELEVTQRAREKAADLAQLHFMYPTDTIDRIRDGKLDHISFVHAFARFERDILATRTPDPTPVALSDEEAFRQMHLLYNYIDDDSIQFTRWQMVGAMSHGMRLAHPPAVPADGLVEALEWYADQMCEGLCQGKDPKACAAIGADNCAGCPAVVALAAHRGEA